MKQTLKHAILYLRVSTEEQVENYSMGTQEEICTREAERLGYIITEAFREEGKSAKTITGRSELIRLLEYCRKHKNTIQAVIFYKTDRLSRQITDYLVIKEKLNRIGIKLISATEPFDDSPMGKFIGNFYAGIAQLDNEMKSERAKNGMHARFRSGLVCSGKAQLGYIRQDGYVFKDMKTWDRVKKAWDLMATGTKSLKEMTTLMNDWGLRTTLSGVEYRIRRQTVHRLFRSKFYAGYLVSKLYNEEVLGQHEPMITLKQFEKVQGILDNRYNKPSLVIRNYTHVDFPLRRIVKCSTCGGGFTGSWCKRHIYPYYWCYKSLVCRSPYVHAKVLHGELNIILKNLKLSQIGKDIFLLLLKDEYSKRYSRIKMHQSKGKQMIDKFSTMRTNLVSKHLSGIYSDEVFAEQNDMLSQNIKRLKQAINANSIQGYTLSLCEDYVSARIDKLVNTFDNLDVYNRKALLSTIFPQGFVWNYPGLSFPAINPLFEV